MPPIAEAYVCGHLHGGPHDSETVWMPWASLEVPALGWDAETPVVSLYRLHGPWLGQDTAHYRYVQPPADVQLPLFPPD